MRKALVCLALMVAAAPVGAQTLFATGFEASEGYALGILNGQQGWTESATPYEGYVTDQVAYQGTQALLFTANHGRAAVHALSAPGTFLGVEIVMGKAYVNTGQWWLALQGAGGTNERSAVFGFNNGQLSYYNGPSGGGGSWVGIRPFNAGQAYHFKAVVNIPQNKWSLWIDGVLEASDIPLYHSTAVSATQVYLYRGYLSLSGLPTDANYAAADDLSVYVIPEPASALTLLAGLGAICGSIRRRR